MAFQYVYSWTALLAAITTISSANEQVFITRSDHGRFKVMSSIDGPLGSDGVIRGAGGGGHLEAAERAGADALRTWGVDGLGALLADAQSHGLRVSAGIWLPHSARRYEECTDLWADSEWQADYDRYITAVKQHRNSSGLLWWTVGNEEELEVDVRAGNNCVWKRVEWVARAVKEADPNHPVGTVMAGVAEAKVRSAFEHCSSLDFLGVNSYGDDSLKIGSQLREWAWTKPYAIMEYGPSGHWASPQTEWGSYIEESSSQKVPRYNATCHTCYEDSLCVGAFAFVWGWKWEKTGTWYNLFNEWPAVTEGVAVNCSSCESEVLATLQKCWTGEDRSSSPPSILGVEVDGELQENMSFVVDRRPDVHLKVRAFQPQGQGLVAIWTATEEVVSKAIGGAHEGTNPLLAGVWPSEQSEATSGVGLGVGLNTTGLLVGGQYRLYIFVRQDPSTCQGSCIKQEAAASLAFKICHTTLPGEECHDHVRYAMLQGIRAHPQTYPGLLASSSFEEFQMLLHQKREGNCPAPCGLRAWCHTSTKGEECHSRVQWVMGRGMAESPGLYPVQLLNADFRAVQWYLHRNEVGLCPQPCPNDSESDTSDESATTNHGSLSSAVGLFGSARSLCLGFGLLSSLGMAFLF